MLQLSFKNREEFEEFFFGPNSEKEMIFDCIVNQIEGALLENKKNATFAEIKFDGDPELVILELPKGNWLDSLNNALAFYEKSDLFEKCITVSNIIKKLDLPKKKKSS
jgi:hypothetical protein